MPQRQLVDCLSPRHVVFESSGEIEIEHVLFCIDPMELRSTRVLVTGADGFIGSHLVELLVEAGAEVTALSQYNSFNDWGWLEQLPCLPGRPGSQVTFGTRTSAMN